MSLETSAVIKYFRQHTVIMFTAEHPEGTASSLMLYRFAEGDPEIISYIPGTALAFSASTNTTCFSAKIHCNTTEGTLQNFVLVTTKA